MAHRLVGFGKPVVFTQEIRCLTATGHSRGSGTVGATAWRTACAAFRIGFAGRPVPEPDRIDRPGGKPHDALLLHLFSAFAEVEREIIRERVRAAKDNGGRPLDAHGAYSGGTRRNG